MKGEAEATPLADALERVASRRVLLFGGKGGAGKTTIAIAAALHLARTKQAILFTTDPASNLSDFLAGTRSGSDRLTIESIDAARLYDTFLGTNLKSFLELGDRGTYLDRDELRRFFELSLPGIDELMAWSRIGELAESNPGAAIVVDTAPTGHTLRMLGSSAHFRQVSAALEAMQAKHHAIVEQLTRRAAHDDIDEFIENFEAQAERRRALLSDRTQSAFVPVMLSEPWVVEQTLRLVAEVREAEIDVPFAILNRAVVEADCERDRRRLEADGEARRSLGPLDVIDAARSCVPLDSGERIEAWSMRGTRQATPDKATGRGRPAAAREKPTLLAGGAPALLRVARLTFFAGKGGVGKTTCSASLALQLAARYPGEKVVVLSVDPAHSIRDVFAHEKPPGNLAVETVDTRARWREFRETIGEEIERAVDSITPRGLSVAYDADAMQKLVEIAPPGADEIFAITRLWQLVEDRSIRHIVVDTAPTGHFLRLLDLPKTAGEWVREFMRIVLHYRDLIPPGALGQELLRAARALTALQEALASQATSIIAVTRPERIVVAETKRLLDDLERRKIPVGAVVANYLTPDSDCRCDRQMREFEVEALRELEREVVPIERRDEPVTALRDIAMLLPQSE